MYLCCRYSIYVTTTLLWISLTPRFSVCIHLTGSTGDHISGNQSLRDVKFQRHYLHQWSQLKFQTNFGRVIDDLFGLKILSDCSSEVSLIAFDYSFGLENLSNCSLILILSLWEYVWLQRFKNFCLNFKQCWKVIFEYIICATYLTYTSLMALEWTDTSLMILKLNLYFVDAIETGLIFYWQHWNWIDILLMTLKLNQYCIDNIEIELIFYQWH